MNEITKGANEPPPYEHVLLQSALYDEFPVEENALYVKAILFGPAISIDCYCVFCKKQSIFRQNIKSSTSATYSLTQYQAWLKNRVWVDEFICQRSDYHQYHYTMRLHKKSLSKIGQWPSLADIAMADTLRFKTVLGENYQRELRRAIGLYAHGIGVGSFVYLRRIFESLISAQRDAARLSGIALEGFDQWRMEDKIGALKDNLPEALVENKAAYGVLSAGIHELDEETCRRHFAVVKLAIEMILDEHLEAERKKKAKSDLKRALGTTAQEVKAAKTTRSERSENG